MSNTDLVQKIFLDIAVIILICRLVTIVGQKFLGQTTVVCEMLAGFILGPSVFGWLFPALQQTLFPIAPIVLMDGSTLPSESMAILFVLSQLGLLFFMFLAGIDFNPELLKKHSKSLAFVAVIGMLVPFILGIMIALLTWHNNLFVDNIDIKVGAIYLGVVMSITAFPVLIRIMQEKQLSKTPLGAFTLATGSISDAGAWLLMAIIFSITQNNILLIFIAAGGGLLYVMFLYCTSKSWKKLLLAHFDAHHALTKQLLAIIMIMLLIAAVITAGIGIHTVFGAFVLGVFMPKGAFGKRLKSKLSSLTSSILLPIFFTFSGLNTQISLIDTPKLWLITILITIIAVVGKGLACTIGARLIGMAWRESCIFGVLMNTRGIMELVILNIGLQANIITPRLFTMMIIMTFVTTFMTTPLINLLDHRRKLRMHNLASKGFSIKIS